MSAATLGARIALKTHIKFEGGKNEARKLLP